MKTVVSFWFDSRKKALNSWKVIFTIFTGHAVLKPGQTWMKRGRRKESWKVLGLFLMKWNIHKGAKIVLKSKDNFSILFILKSHLKWKVCKCMLDICMIYFLKIEISFKSTKSQKNNQKSLENAITRFFIVANRNMKLIF